jgi:hypothetical protein
VQQIALIRNACNLLHAFFCANKIIFIAIMIESSEQSGGGVSGSWHSYCDYIKSRINLEV